MRLVLLAPPGAGKGTQSRRLSEEYDIPHVETGSILRQAIQNGTDLGKKAQQYINDGNLVPDKIMVQLVRDRLARPDCADGFILDGFPRTEPQAEQFDNVLEQRNLNLTGVVFLDVRDEVVFSRLKKRRVCENCGTTYHLDARPPEDEGSCNKCDGSLIRREDDNRQAIEHRLDVYRDKTRPLLDYYRERDLLLEIDGEQPIHEVTRSIVQKLDQRSVPASG